MTRELIIMRHAKSDWSGSLADFDRPLNPRGENDAPRMGAWLRAEGWLPDHVVSSPARRAEQTVKRVCRALAVDPATIRWEPRIYEAGVGTLLAVLAECPVCERVLLVGHNPGLERLSGYLCPTLPESPDGKLLTTAAVARIALPDDWRELGDGDGELLRLMRPSGLPE